MKRIFKLLLTTLIPFVLPSCASNPNSDNGNQIVINQVYKTNYWDDTIIDLMKYSIGDQYVNIPEFITTRYEGFASQIVKDNVTITYTNIKCFGVSSQSANRLYAEKMEEKEFYVLTDLLYGYRFVDYSKDLFLNYGMMKDETTNETFFNLQMSVRETRELEWASSFIQEYMEVDVPSCEAEAYNFAYDDYYERIIVNALFVNDGALNTYKNKLISNHYVLTGTDEGYGGFQLVDPTGYVTVTIYDMVGEYECKALYIQIDNSWPTLEIGAFLGVYLPKLQSESAVYGGWNYYDPDQTDGDTSDYVLLIFYDYASNADYDNYLTQLVNAGFSSGTTTNNDGILITPLTATHPNGKSLELSLQYQISTNTICLAVYQAK